MTKKEIKKLALASYTNSKLDINKVNKIIKSFTNSDLKNYIRYLRLNEKSKSITVEIPNLLEKKEIINKIKKMYPNKNVTVRENKDIIAGIKITNNDIIYEANLKNNLENLVTHINY